MRFSILWIALSQFTRALFANRSENQRTVFQEALVGILRQNGLRLIKLPPSMARHRIEIMSAPCSVRRLITRAKVDVGGLPGEWFRPKGVTTDAAILYLHGGGYVLGSTEGYRDLLGRLALACELPLLAIDYRLAPEHPFPAAVDDCATALRWLGQSGIAPERTIIAGDSSGGALAISAMLVARDRGDALPRAAFLLSPWVDLSADTGSIHSNAGTDWGDGEYLRHWAELYLADTAATDPLASPGHADLHGLPPLLLQVGSGELLLDQVTAFASRAQQAGGQAELKVFPNMAHAWHMLSMAFPQADEALAQLAGFVKAQLVEGPRSAVSQASD